MAMFTVASLLAFAATPLAQMNYGSMQKRNSLATVNAPSPDDVSAAINDWDSDVKAVNNFLDNAQAASSDLASLALSAQNILDNFASDEGSQLNTLNNWFVNTDQPDNGLAPVAFNCAFSDLANGQTYNGEVFSFGDQVIDPFKALVQDANLNNLDDVQIDLQQINSFRCCNVLPDLDILWRDAAQSAGLKESSQITTGDVPFSPSRPITCEGIDCSTVHTASNCGTLDNGRFGTPGS
jgi:hypothetical protein